MLLNQKCVVINPLSKFAGRTGYFQFFGKGTSAGCVVLTNNPTTPRNNSGEYFAVKNDDIEPVLDSKG